jgi:TolB protein
MLPFRADVYAWDQQSDPRRVSPAAGIFYQSCIDPNGEYVIFGGAPSGPPRIWRCDLATGSDATPVSPGDSGARHPVCSWDGTRVVFTSDRTFDGPPQPVEEMSRAGVPIEGNLFSMNPDGSAVVQLTEGPYLDQRPSFSPDGSTIVFVSNRESAITLWTVTAEGDGEPERLAYRGPGYRPWFSADGDAVFFFRDVEGRHQICRIGLDDEKFEPLANDDSGNSHGPFSDPAGDVLLMHSTRGADFYSIWELPLDGSAPRMIEVPGIAHPLHPTRSRSGIMAFDVVGRASDDR